MKLQVFQKDFGTATGSSFMSDAISDIVIIDDFLPEDLRQKLIAPDREFKSIDEVYYAGDTGFIAKAEQEIITTVLKNKLPVDFRDYQCRLRRTRPENQKTAESFIHTDHFAEYSAILYLNDGVGKKGEPTGTYFWESKLTKSKGMRTEEMKKMYKDLMLVNKMTFELENWDCWSKMDQKANRLVFFPSRLYHSPPLIDIEMGERVTLDIFLNLKFDFKYKKREKT
jgi:Family of unknown function (DUF6445)